MFQCHELQRLLWLICVAAVHRHDAAALEQAGLVSNVTNQLLPEVPHNNTSTNVTELPPSVTPADPNTTAARFPSTASAAVTSNHNSSTEAGQKSVPGNTWKFTACVAALALTTASLIVCAVKGPSWYRLFHNYRHQLLREESGDTLSANFSDTSRRVNHRTFTFQTDRMAEEAEEEDVYFEDPYIKREDGTST